MKNIRSTSKRIVFEVPNNDFITTPLITPEDLRGAIQISYKDQQQETATK